MTEDQKKFAVQLLDIGAVKLGKFKLKLHDTHPQAPLSPVYLDLRLLRRFPAAKSSAVAVYENLTAPLRFDLLADVPTAATPLVSSLADRLNVGMITPRRDSKTHGTGSQVDGLTPQDTGKTALLVDDLVTRADSKLEAAAILRSHGLTVTDVVVLIDREQGGRQQLAAAGLFLHSALTLMSLLDFYLDTGRIGSQAYRETLRNLDALNLFLGRV